MFKVPEHWVTLPIHPLTKTPLRKFKTDADKKALPPYQSLPGLNWAVIATASGVTIVDFDSREGWAYASRKVAEGVIPHPGLVTLTGSGKWHWYYKAPAKGCPNRANLLGMGIDIRGDNGYALIPPSIHPATKQPYKWAYPTPLEGWPVFDPAWFGITLKVKPFEGATSQKRNIYVKEEFNRLLSEGKLPDPSKAGPMASDRWHINGYALTASGKTFYVANGGGIFFVEVHDAEKI